MEDKIVLELSYDEANEIIEALEVRIRGSVRYEKGLRGIILRP